MTENKKVLIVDDDPDFSTLLSIRLKKKGFSVETASNAEEAIQKLQLNQPDILLSDFQLPGLSGKDLVQKMKTDNSIPKVPTIFLSGNLDIANTAKELGVQALSKPFEFEDLVALINESLS